MSKFQKVSMKNLMGMGAAKPQEGSDVAFVYILLVDKNESAETLDSIKVLEAFAETEPDVYCFYIEGLDAIAFSKVMKVKKRPGIVLVQGREIISRIMGESITVDALTAALQTAQHERL